MYCSETAHTIPLQVVTVLRKRLLHLLAKQDINFAMLNHKCRIGPFNIISTLSSKREVRVFLLVFEAPVTSGVGIGKHHTWFSYQPQLPNSCFGICTVILSCALLFQSFFFGYPNG